MAIYLVLSPTIKHACYHSGHCWWHQCPESPCRPGDAISTGPETWPANSVTQCTLSWLCDLPAAWSCTWPCTYKLDISVYSIVQNEVALRRDSKYLILVCPSPTSSWQTLLINHSILPSLIGMQPPNFFLILCSRHGAPIKVNQHLRWKLILVPNVILYFPEI